MKFSKILIAGTLATAAAVLPAAAKQAPGTVLEAVKVVDASLVKSGPMMEVGCELDLSGVSLGSNERVIITPVLVGINDSVALPPLVVNGRNAAIKYERERSQRVDGAADVMKLRKGEPAAWAFATQIPYEDWMELSHLTLREDLCGCGDLQGQACRPVGPEFDNRPPAEMVLLYVQPVVEATKARAEEGSAFVDYQVNKTNILPDYRNNRAEIAKITKTIDLVKNDPLVSITEINIHGYASPEGSYANNARLAEGRALSLKNYVKSLYTLSDRLFTSSSTPEDWAGLRVLVEKSTLADREAILSVIDSDLQPDAKDAALRSRFPQSYQVMLTQMYPALRHSDYKVKYVVRPLTVEETALVMKRSPKQASLQEMFLVAQTYEPGSEEFNEAMAIAVATYPDDPVANLNAGLAAVSAADYAAAARYLAKAGDSGEASLARAQLAMKTARYDEAAALLAAARAAGIDTAANDAILERLRQLDRQNRN